MVVYPVPQLVRPQPHPAQALPTAFLPAAPAADVELPSLIMAPVAPAGWPRP
jgi:hypothetical protein